MDFKPGDYVLRRVNVCGVQDIWYGHVLFGGYSRNGRLLVVVEGPEFVFVSDPSHLEKAYYNDTVQPLRAREDNRASQ